MDVSGNGALIWFYITRGDGFLLLDNEILHQHYLQDPEDHLRIPVRRLGKAKERIYIPVYFESTNNEESQARRTYRVAVELNLLSFMFFFTFEKSFVREELAVPRGHEMEN